MKGLSQWVFLLFLIVLTGCASDDDKWLANQRAAVPPISGGFTFKQYVTVNPGDKEVVGDEGVLYISPTMFTDEQLADIEKSEHGKDAIYGDQASAYFHLIDTCLSSVSRASGKAGDAAGYLALVLTSAIARKDNPHAIRFRLYAWPDFWYDWSIYPTGDEYTVQDTNTNQAWGWSESRIVLTRDSSVTLDACVNYRDSTGSSSGKGNATPE